jgi:hypothetical protein
MEEIYFFMHMHDGAYSPELSKHIAEKLNAAWKPKLLMPDVKNLGSTP